MKLISLHLENFRQHANSRIEFPERGLVGIVGSNEGGKSTILEGVAFAIFGVRAARGSKETIRWNRAPGKRQASARLVFEVGGKRYEIVRTESDAVLIDHGTNAKIAAGTAAVNEYLPTLIGMGLEEFRATYMCEQKDLGRISAMKGTERRVFFLQVLGVGKIDEALAACRKRRNELGHEVEGLTAGLGERGPLESELGAAHAAVSEAEGALSSAQYHLTQVTQTAADAAEQFAASEMRARRYDAARQQVMIAETAVRTAEKEVERVRQGIANAERAAQRVAEQAPQLEQLPALQDEREQLRAAKGAVDARRAIEQAIATNTQTLQATEKRIADAEADVAAHDNEQLEADEQALEERQIAIEGLRDERREWLAAARADLAFCADELKRQARRINAIRDAGRDGPCPTCARKLGEQFDAVLRDLVAENERLVLRQKQAAAREKEAAQPSRTETSVVAQVAELQKVVEAGRRRADAAVRARKTVQADMAHAETLRRELAKQREQLADLPVTTYDAARLAAVEQQIRQMEELARALEADRIAAAAIADLNAQLLQRGADVQQANAVLQQRHADFKAVGFDAEEHDAFKSAAEAARNAREAAQTAVARAEGALNAARDRQVRASHALAAYDTRAEVLTEKREELRVHEITAQRLADYRAATAATIRPEMEELVSGFVSILTDGRHESATLSDDFEATLQESGVDVPVVSGGTEDIAAIALRLAVSQMIAQRAGHPLSLLALDEPFGSLDPVRRSNVLNLIRRLGGVFEQVLVITHVEEVREAVDTVVLVTYDEAAGCSSVAVLGGARAVEAVELQEVAA